MKILITAMAAMAETGGPVSRSIALARYLSNKGYEVATCMAEDVNYKHTDVMRNYFLAVPMPLGAPEIIGKNIFPIVQKLGISSAKTVNSFDEVLTLTGNLDYRYLKKSVDNIRIAIKEFQPDVVYSEFSIPAMIAALTEKTRLYTTVSYPTRHEYACNPKLAKGLNRFLAANGIAPVESALKLFDFADRKFCLSIEALEPMTDAIYCGAWKEVRRTVSERNKILVYFGNGTVSADRMKNEITKAFINTPYEVYIASAYLKPCEEGNIHIAGRWDFDELLNGAMLFINHGGQNSIVQGLRYGVPQLVVPGKVFERRFNAETVRRNGAGLVLTADEFNSAVIREKADSIISDPVMKDRAAKLGDMLMSAGGFARISEALEADCSSHISLKKRTL